MYKVTSFAIACLTLTHAVKLTDGVVPAVVEAPVVGAPVVEAPVVDPSTLVEAPYVGVPVVEEAPVVEAPVVGECPYAESYYEGGDAGTLGDCEWYMNDEGEYVQGCDDIEWEFDFGGDMMHDMVVKGLGLTGDEVTQFETYIAEYGYDFLEEDDWDWSILEDDAEAHKPYVLDGKPMEPTKKEMDALKKKIASKADFTNKLISVEQIFEKFNMFEEAFESLAPGSAEFEAAVTNDADYFADTLTWGLESLAQGIADGFGTEADMWAMIDQEDVKTVLEVLKELGGDSAYMDTELQGQGVSVEDF